MKIQEYLRSGKSLNDLKAECGIEATFHDTLPLAILNYNQIESPKTHPLVREARGVTLNTESWDLACACMRRFYNWGEVQEEMDNFDWSSCTTQEKADGSLVHIYYFDGQWHANTRGSFGYGPIFNTEWAASYHKLPLTFTWRDAFLSALNVKDLSELNLDKSLTYVCEFCSLWNKVVRKYQQPWMYLLTRFHGEQEIGPCDMDCFHKLYEYPLRSAEECSKFVTEHPEVTFEGLVVKDSALNRWKIKNPKYLSLHRMKGGNGDNLYLPKNLLPFILTGEGDELLAVYPEVTDCYKLYKEKVDTAYAQLDALWQQTKHIENQKEFALSIVGKTPFTGLLFTARKEKKQLRDLWHENADGILKVLF